MPFLILFAGSFLGLTIAALTLVVFNASLAVAYAIYLAFGIVAPLGHIMRSTQQKRAALASSAPRFSRIGSF